MSFAFQNRCQQDISAYLDCLEGKNLSASYQKSSAHALNLLLLYLEEAHGRNDWRAVGIQHLRGFAVFLRERHRTTKGKQVSRDSIRLWLSRLRCFFRWMRQTGRLAQDPAKRLELPKKGKALPRVLSEAEMARLLDQPDLKTAAGLRDRALMEVLYATGIRHREASRLDLYDIDLGVGQLIVRLGKGGKDRLVPLTQTACQWLGRYLEAGRPELAAGYAASRKSKAPRLPHPTALWLSSRGSRLGYVSMADRIGQYARQAGVKASPHTFRHCCATHLLRGGASIRHIQQLLGHAELDTTEIYTHLVIEDLKKTVQQAESNQDVSE